MGNEQRTAFYIRVSSGEQTVASQQWALKEYCDMMDIPIPPKKHHYIDEDVSAYKIEFKKRPGAGELYRKCLEGRYDKVITTRIDRLCRSVGDLYYLMEDFTKAGVGIVFTQQELSNDGPEGDLIRTILGGYAQYEAAMVSKRTKEALSYLKSKGKKLGRPSLSLAHDSLLDVVEARMNGATISACAKQLGISRASLREIFGDVEHVCGFCLTNSKGMPREQLAKSLWSYLERGEDGNGEEGSE